MKRTILLFTALFAISSVSLAQIKFGLRGGISSSSINVDEVIGGAAEDYYYELESGDAMIGYHFGAMMRVTLFGAFIQPEVLFSSSGGEVKIKDLTENTEYFRNQTYNKISIPVMVGFKLGPARLQAGPAASFTLSSKPALEDLVDQVEEDFKTATFGYQAGIGLDVLNFLAIDLKYEGNLSKLGEGITLGNYTASFDTRNPQIILSLGIMF
ncbi:MAG TPA: PorT family protein [Bacteroidetes bacterium]|nr:PorT family protein [Bacteroidota bacterium]